MTWQCFQVIYELLSPLHIGYRKVGNVQRTRYYIPARNIWGAVTEALTRRGFQVKDAPQGSYEKMGEWVKAHCAFGYWFVRANGQGLEPCYEQDGLKYGGMTAFEFERCYLGSHVTTALEPATTSAEEGSLHEVEFISPFHPFNPAEEEKVSRTELGGWLFLDEVASSLLGDDERWRSWLVDLQIGGERRYGFGRLRLLHFIAKICPQAELDGPRPRWNLKEGESLPAHAAVDGVAGKGAIEPFVGRETARSDGFGQKLTEAEVCWEPGTVLQAATSFEITTEGIWKKIESR